MIFFLNDKLKQYFCFKDQNCVLHFHDKEKMTKNALISLDFQRKLSNDYSKFWAKNKQQLQKSKICQLVS